MPNITTLSQLDIQNGKYTYADYLSWHFDQTVELIRGRIQRISTPNRKHQRISWQLTLAVGNFFKKHDCRAFAAPFDVRLPDQQKSKKVNKEIFTVVQPDICIVCNTTKLDDKGCLGAPDLVVEILSPGNSVKEMKIKKNLYETAGIREYWIIDPEHENVFQFHLNEAMVYTHATIYTSEDVLHCVIFPDLHITLSEIFMD